MKRRTTKERSHVFDKPENTRRTLRLLYWICAALFLVDFVYHRHVIDPWEDLLGFYAVYGFVACTILVLVAKQMRKVLMRREDFYDRND
ncbi:MAG: hypothetical protein ACE5K1_04770 [Acidiferrobacterales bacterium]